MPSDTLPTPPCCSRHAADRMLNRGIRSRVVELVLEHGRLVHARGAAIRVVGRREVRRAQARGLDLREADGVHVVLDPDGHQILTVYRNHDLRGLRPRRRTRRWKKAGTGFDRRSVAAMMRGTYRTASRPALDSRPAGTAAPARVRITTTEDRRGGGSTDECRWAA